MADLSAASPLDGTRLGILITNKRDGMPIGVPVWFDWDGEIVRCFAERGSKKLKRLARDPRASLLVTTGVGEPEAWVAFDGTVTVRDEGAIQLAEKLAVRYYDLSDPVLAKRLVDWQASPDAFVLLELTPASIRRG